MQNYQGADEINQQIQVMKSSNPQIEKQIAQNSKIKQVDWKLIKTQNEEKVQNINEQHPNQIKETQNKKSIQTQNISNDQKNSQKQKIQIHEVDNSQEKKIKQFIKIPNIERDQNESKQFFETSDIFSDQQSLKQILKQQKGISLKNIQQIYQNNNIIITNNVNSQSNQVQQQQNKLIKQLSLLTLSQNQIKLNKQNFVNQILLKYKIDQDDYQDFKKQFYQSNIPECCQYAKKILDRLCKNN